MTTLRMLLAPVIAYDIVSGNYATAAGVFAFAGALDWADGWVARKFKGQSSLLGTFLDPIADKVLVACVGGALGWTGLLHPALIGLFIGRDLLLVGGAFYLRAKTRPQGACARRLRCNCAWTWVGVLFLFVEPRTAHRLPLSSPRVAAADDDAAGQAFFALSEANTKIEPTQLSKVNTALQLGVVVASLAQAAWGVPPPAAVSALCWVTAGTTIWSGIDYALNSGMKVGASAAAARARVQALKATVSERMQSMRARAGSARSAAPPQETDAATTQPSPPALEPADGVWEVAPAGGRAAALRPLVHVMRAVQKRSVADIASVTGLDAAVVRLLLGLGARAV